MKPTLLLAAILLAGVTMAAEAPWAIPGDPSVAGIRTFVREYPVLGADGNTVVGTQAWLVANATGNSAENHVTVGPTGRIIDIGGLAPTFSDDEGRTWKRFVPLGTLPAFVLGAEGSGSMAPNGDWVGMTWDPQYADRVIAYKYVAAEDQWYSSHVALHGPFYDRPWIGVVPGPITVAGATYPYATLLNGGWPTRSTYMSFDGLTYALVSHGDVSFVARNVSWLDEPAGVAWADWVHPIASARVMPLPGGGAVAVADRLCGWTVVETDATMHCFNFPDGTRLGGNGAPRFDSQGRLHLFDAARGGINHRMSTDGGRTWTTTFLPLPTGALYRGGMIDSAVNGALDMAVVGVRADHPTGSKIIIHKITDLSTAPVVKTYQVGNGDLHFSQGVTASIRMDFMSLGLLPDGRVVTSFGDKLHPSPRLAIEQP